MAKLDLDLCYLTATEAVAKFKTRELSPVELTEALITRSAALNPKLNVLTELKTDTAIKAARAAEARYKNSKTGRARPLEGVPVAIKDFHPIKGEITTFGSKAYADFRPTQSAPTVDRLFKAGAILLSRTTTPELAHCGITKSPLWGVSRNPWNPKYTCGGSSGGSGAAVAAGMTTIADGTDGGGSIRIPSAINGIFGYKPPFGRNPLDADHPLETLLHYGPMTRSVADAALMQNIMSGQHVLDICSLRDNCVLPEKCAAIRGLKIAFSMNLGYFEVADDVQKNTREAVAVLKKLGAKVEEVDVGWNETVLDAWQTWWEGLFAGLCANLLPRWRHHMTPMVEFLLERGLSHSGAKLYQSNLVRGWMYQKLGPILEKYDALVCPTVAVSCLDAEHNDMASDFRINGNKVPAYVGWAMTYPFNMMGWCPVASVPTGFGATSMPTGMQIVGRTFDDHTVFQIASAFEQAKPWRGVRPNI
jgi:Asp-tRNA(Asn)/Glu-tRNA(Gln) amidotransferase A subunit family amidase